MAARYGTSQIVVTKDGECHLTITLELNINLNSDGVTASVQSVKSPNMEDDDDKVIFEVPDFTSGNTIDFGKESS